MDNKNMTNLNPSRAIYNVLGSICQDTDMLKDSEVQLKPTDFMQSLHQTVFKAINNIIYNASGDHVSTISAKDIDNYLSSYPTQYKLWNDQNGYDYIENCLKHANKETFNQSYDRVKKMSVLRAYVEKGFDVSELYDWESDDFLSREQSLQKLDKKELKDIFEYFTLKNLQIKDEYNIESTSRQYKAGENVTQLLEQFKQGKEYGFPFSNGYENYLIRGMRKGKFLLRSGSTGTMKTSLAIRDMVRVSTSEYYENGKWHFNGVSAPALFISTELDVDELTVIVLANMTGVPRRVIEDGKFNKEQRGILEKAGEILKDSPLYLVHIPDFSVGDIEEIIERHILDYDVQYVAFDYIQLVPRLQRTTNEMFGTVQREDQVLLQLSSALKMFAERYNVFIESSTQLNRNAKQEENRDATSLRGSSAIADKIDAGELLFRAKESDRAKVKDIIEENGFGKEPNYMRYLFKNRSGQTDLILWSHMNASTVREDILFVTDYDFNIVEDVEDLQFEFKEGRTDKDLKDEEEYGHDSKVFGDTDVKQDIATELDF